MASSQAVVAVEAAVVIPVLQLGTSVPPMLSITCEIRLPQFCVEPLTRGAAVVYGGWGKRERILF